MSQIMSLLNLAPDIQEAILFLTKSAKGRDADQFAGGDPAGGGGGLGEAAGGMGQFTTSSWVCMNPKLERLLLILAQLVQRRFTFDLRGLLPEVIRLLGDRLASGFAAENLPVR